MIAILRTACGCEKALNVSYPPPTHLRVPLLRQTSLEHVSKAFAPTASLVRMRTFERGPNDTQSGYPVYLEVLE